MRAAVITEALSARYFFPLWYKYYSTHFGCESLYVVSPAGTVGEFDKFRLGGVTTLPKLEIDETRRSNMVSDLVKALLRYYDVVLRVDTDEFLIADPRRWQSIREYIEAMTAPYATALGIDVFQNAMEAPLDGERSILGAQRQYGYLTSSMSKTAVTSVPIDWGPGFHFCNVYPEFAELYLFHLKRVDIDMQVQWFSEISGFEFKDKNMANYYAPDIDKIRNFHLHASRRVVIEGWPGLDRSEFANKFFDSLKFDRSTGIYRGAHFADDVVVRLPSEMNGLL